VSPYGETSIFSEKARYFTLELISAFAEMVDIDEIASFNGATSPKRLIYMAITEFQGRR
jgi:hypothetical protein